MLRSSTQGMQRVEFLHQICRMLLDASGADLVELCVRETDQSPYWHARLGLEQSFLVEIVTPKNGFQPIGPSKSPPAPGAEELCDSILQGRLELASVVFTKSGVLWDYSRRRPLTASTAAADKHLEERSDEEAYRSLMLAPLEAASTKMGVLGLKSKKAHYFTEEDVEFCEDLAQTLSVALVNRHAQSALRERVKELTCLYGIARLVESPGTPRDTVLKGIVNLLPPAWQYPEITVGRIVLDGRPYGTRGFRDDTGQKQTADIIVNGEIRGTVEVVYLKERPRRDEGPFLKEERHLIDAIAREVARLVERDLAEGEKRLLQEQLWHSDRLATVGEMAAGVAHELNEPLGSILGFAQLMMKRDDLPSEASEDIDKIVAAALHAREVIRKLMLFARQKSPSKTTVNLNEVIEDGLYFFSSRCAAAGVDVVRDLANDLPWITADPVQLHQALINLITNAIYAMPQGGTLIIRTRNANRFVSLVVEDNGTGMSEEVASRVFLPFYTTKDVNEGTGLGLSVVHGIVTSHGGTITVESEEGRGSSFEIMLPVSGPPEQEERS